jgi:lipoprotein-anchoring transpeptidase ErfK/SrfK
VFRFVLCFVAAAVGAVAFAPPAGPPHPIASGVRIAGIGAAGLDAEQARQLVKGAFGKPVRFRVGGKTWAVEPGKLGAEPLVDDAVSRALHADENERVDVRVAVDRNRVRDYVAQLERRFARPAVDAQVTGLSGQHPLISAEQWGQAVRRGTMVAAITRMLRTRIRPPIPVVLRPLKPAKTRAHFGPVVVIRRGSNQLTLFNGTRTLRTFKVATGQAAYPTPTGNFAVADKQRNPWWRPPDSEWAQDAKPIPPGPGNPLGTRWMGLTAPLVGIHGTPDAASVGYSASHGCIRMYIPDADWLFDQVEIGTPVLIVD